MSVFKNGRYYHYEFSARRGHAGQAGAVLPAMLAESHLTKRLFGAMVGRIAA